MSVFEIDTGYKIYIITRIFKKIELNNSKLLKILNKNISLQPNF
jgi:hypothetical protein